jgi:hypothetical protein
MRSGCQWIALEDSGQPQDRLAQRLLQAVQTADVERVRSFPIETYHSGSVHLYRWRQPVVRPAYLDLAFPDLGPDVRFSVEPIAPKLPQ